MPLSFAFDDQETACEITGSNTPYVLKLSSTTTDASMLLFSTDNTSNASGYWVGMSNNAIMGQPTLVVGSNQLDFMTVSQDGNIGIGTNMPMYKLHCAGDLFAQGNLELYQISDARIKENINDADLGGCYNIVKHLPLRTWRWSYDAQTSSHPSLGWIAQEVEGILPFAVKTNEAHGLHDCKTLNHDYMLKCLYGAAKHLMDKVERLEDQVRELQMGGGGTAEWSV